MTVELPNSVVKLFDIVKRGIPVTVLNTAIEEKIPVIGSKSGISKLTSAKDAKLFLNKIRDCFATAAQQDLLVKSKSVKIRKEITTESTSVYDSIGDDLTIPALDDVESNLVPTEDDQDTAVSPSHSSQKNQKKSKSHSLQNSPSAVPAGSTGHNDKMLSSGIAQMELNDKSDEVFRYGSREVGVYLGEMGENDPYWPKKNAPPHQLWSVKAYLVYLINCVSKDIQLNLINYLTMVAPPLLMANQITFGQAWKLQCIMCDIIIKNCCGMEYVGPRILDFMKIRRADGASVRSLFDALSSGRRTVEEGFPSFIKDEILFNLLLEQVSDMERLILNEAKIHSWNKLQKWLSKAHPEAEKPEQDYKAMNAPIAARVKQNTNQSKASTSPRSKSKSDVDKIRDRMGRPCRQWSSEGSCSYGRNCQFSHDKSAEQLLSERERRPSGASQARTLLSESTATSKRPRSETTSAESCRRFAAGTCNSGANCRYSHDADDIQAQKRVKFDVKADRVIDGVIIRKKNSSYNPPTKTTAKSSQRSSMKKNDNKKKQSYISIAANAVQPRGQPTIALVSAGSTTSADVLSMQRVHGLPMATFEILHQRGNYVKANAYMDICSTVTTVSTAFLLQIGVSNQSIDTGDLIHINTLNGPVPATSVHIIVKNNLGVGVRIKARVVVNSDVALLFSTFDIDLLNINIVSHVINRFKEGMPKVKFLSTRRSSRRRKPSINIAGSADPNAKTFICLVGGSLGNNRNNIASSINNTRNLNYNNLLSNNIDHLSTAVRQNQSCPHHGCNGQLQGTACTNRNDYIHPCDRNHVQMAITDQSCPHRGYNGQLQGTACTNCNDYIHPCERNYIHPCDRNHVQSATADTSGIPVEITNSNTITSNYGQINQVMNLINYGGPTRSQIESADDDVASSDHPLPIIKQFQVGIALDECDVIKRDFTCYESKTSVACLTSVDLATGIVPYNQTDSIDVDEVAFVSEARAHEAMSNGAGHNLFEEKVDIQINEIDWDKVICTKIKQDNPAGYTQIKEIVIEAISQGVISELAGLLTTPAVKVQVVGNPRSDPVPVWGPSLTKILTAWTNQVVANGSHRFIPTEKLQTEGHLVICRPMVVINGKKIRVTGAHISTNHHTVRVAARVPNAIQIRDEMVGFLYYWQADFNAGYHQQPLHKESQRYFAIHVPGGVVIPTSMSMGGSNFGDHMQSVAEFLIAECPGVTATPKRVWAYIDDTLGGAMSLDELVIDISAFFKKLKTSNGTISIQKLKIGFDKIVALGMVVSRDGIEMNPKFVDAIQSAKLPTNSKELSQTMGLFNYFRSHVKEFATLHKTIGNFKLDTGTRQIAMEQMQERLINATRLNKFDPDAQLCIDTDASNEGCGGTAAILVDPQIHEVGYTYSDQELLLKYFSHAWTLTQLNYVVFVKEAFALIFGLNKCETFIRASKNPTIVRIDQRALMWITSSQQPMVQRWIHRYLLSLRIIIQYRPGKYHINADALSRYFLTGPGRLSALGIIAALIRLIQQGVVVTSSMSSVWLFTHNALDEARAVIANSSEFKYRRMLSPSPTPKLCMSADITKHDVIILVPKIDQVVRAAAQLLGNKRLDLKKQQLFILMPTDLLSILRNSLNELGRERLTDCKYLVYLEDAIVWLTWSAHIETKDVIVAFNQPSVTDTSTKGKEMAFISIKNVLTTNSFTENEIRVNDADPELLKDEHGSYFLKVDPPDRARRLVPEDNRGDILKYIHQFHNHCGQKKLIQLIRDGKLYWKGFKKDAIVYVESCTKCLLSKAKHSMQRQSFSPMITTGRHQNVGIDLKGPFDKDTWGLRYILVMIDMFHNYVMFLPLYEDKSALEIANVMLQYWILVRTPPVRILSDCDKSLLSQIVDRVHRVFGIEFITTAPYSQFQNGAVERRMWIINVFMNMLPVASRVDFPILIRMLAYQTNCTPGIYGFSAMEIEVPDAQVIKLTDLVNNQLDNDTNTEPLPKRVKRSTNTAVVIDQSDVIAEYLANLKLVVQLYDKVLNSIKNSESEINKRIKSPNKQFKLGDLVAIYQVADKAKIGTNQWSGPWTLVDKVASGVFIAKSSRDGKDITTKVSARNMVRWTALIPKGINDCDRSSSLPRMLPRKSAPQLMYNGTDRIADITEMSIAIDDIVAVLDDQLGWNSFVYWLGKVRRVEHDEIEVHYYAATSTTNSTRFNLIFQNKVGKLFLEKRSNFTPYFGICDKLSVIATSLHLTSNDNLSQRSQRVLAQYTPRVLSEWASTVR